MIPARAIMERWRFLRPRLTPLSGSMTWESPMASLLLGGGEMASSSLVDGVLALRLGRPSIFSV